MLRTQMFRCSLPKDEADTLNRESGRAYTTTLVWHYRVYRQTHHWLSPQAGEQLGDYFDGPTLLHAHSRDGAQQGFPKACETARACRLLGLDVRYPYKRKWYRTTIWKSTGIRLRDGRLWLARARGLPPVVVVLPPNLAALPQRAFHEVRLVWDQAARHHCWHLVVENYEAVPAPPGENVVGVDLGEIHPAVATDGGVGLVVSCRELRAAHQYTAKRMAELRSLQDHKHKKSRRWKRLQRRKNRFLAQQKRRTRDMEHKVSRAVVEFAQERGAGTVVIGDTRDVADGKRLKTREQQKIGMWSHGKVRAYITYKAEGAGIVVPEPLDEHYSSQTCPACGQRHKPRGRVYRCPSCGLVAHRDVVGAINILSRYRTGEVGQLAPPSIVKYRHPFLAGKRSRLDTAQVARGQP